MDNSSKNNDDMVRKHTHSNTVQRVECFKQKMLLAQLQEAGIKLNKDQLVVLADTKENINFGLGAFTMKTKAIFQADDIEVKPSSEHSSVVNHYETEITSDSNTIPYSEYATESQQKTV
nr:hypothetical protein [Tanacetum cinerariifolium]